jgi:hypothetical protein
MIDERDERLLSEVKFAQDPKLTFEERESRNSLLHDWLGELGCETAQDVIDLGCTGVSTKLSVDQARFIREHMTGAGFGLPCYVPKHRFCLVHNTIGGLQEGQLARYPQRVEIVSRSLSKDERAKSAAVETHQEAERAAVAASYGAEVVDGDGEMEKIVREVDEAAAAVQREELRTQRGPVIEPGARCPEHDKPEYRCRFCLAAAIVNGPFEPQLLLHTIDESADIMRYEANSAALVLQELQRSLARPSTLRVELGVRVACWERKMVPLAE